jgi:hypothetical protein
VPLHLKLGTHKPIEWADMSQGHNVTHESMSTAEADIRWMDFRNPYMCPHLSSVP